MCPVVVVGHFYALVGHLSELLTLLAERQALARQERACVAFAFAEVVDDPGHILICEEWADLPALERHFRSRRFAIYQQQVDEFVARPAEVRIHYVRQTVLPIDSRPMDPRHAD